MPITGHICATNNRRIHATLPRRCGRHSSFSFSRYDANSFFWTVEKPDSSMLKMDEASKLCSSTNLYNNSKNLSQLSRLKQLKRFSERHSGWRIASWAPAGREKKPAIHFLPAILVTLENGWGILFWTAIWYANFCTSILFKPNKRSSIFLRVEPILPRILRWKRVDVLAISSFRLLNGDR